MFDSVMDELMPFYAFRTFWAEVVLEEAGGLVCDDVVLDRLVEPEIFRERVGTEAAELECRENL